VKRLLMLLAAFSAVLALEVTPAWSGNHPYPGATRSANNAPFYVDVSSDLTGTINYKVPAGSEEGEFNVHCKDFTTVEIVDNTAHVTGKACRLRYDEGTDLDVTFVDNGPEGDFACFTWTYEENGETDIIEDCGVLLRGKIVIETDRVFTFQK
jgi:hypothetical protein